MGDPFTEKKTQVAKAKDEADQYVKFLQTQLEQAQNELTQVTQERDGALEASEVINSAALRTIDELEAQLNRSEAENTRLRDELKQEQKMRDECRYWKDWWKDKYDRVAKLWNESLESARKIS